MAGRKKEIKLIAVYVEPTEATLAAQDRLIDYLLEKEFAARAEARKKLKAGAA